MLLFFFYITNWWCLSLIILEKKKVSCLLPCPEELKGTQTSASPAEVVCPAAANEDAGDWTHRRNPALLQQLLLERTVVTCTAQEGGNPECTKIGFSFGLLAQRKNLTQRSPGCWAGWGLVLPKTPMEVQWWIRNTHKSQKENSDYMEERNVFSMRATKY